AELARQESLKKEKSLATEDSSQNAKIPISDKEDNIAAEENGHFQHPVDESYDSADIENLEDVYDEEAEGEENDEYESEIMLVHS
ncbi:unnamed protein product, partial [Gongylonema pulchrum]|uniref:RNA-binding protein 39 n=1 Tax=Gongylonema pulchrum TaxID=637853 RepID=A0A183ERU1_9BILA